MAVGSGLVPPAVALIPSLLGRKKKKKKDIGCNSGHSNRNGVIASVNVDISKRPQ